MAMGGLSRCGGTHTPGARDLSRGRLFVKLCGVLSGQEVATNTWNWSFSAGKMLFPTAKALFLVRSQLCKYKALSPM